MSRLSLFLSINSVRYFSKSSSCLGKRNFRKFQSFNKRGTLAYRENKLPSYFYQDVGSRQTGVRDEDGNFVEIPEMIPELIVPDLKEFNLKPYVSYKTPDVVQSEFTAKDLFDEIYSKKITEDFNNNKLDELGNPLEPSENEKLDAKTAWINARKTGSDMF